MNTWLVSGTIAALLTTPAFAQETASPSAGNPAAAADTAPGAKPPVVDRRISLSDANVRHIVRENARLEVESRSPTLRLAQTPAPSNGTYAAQFTGLSPLPVRSREAPAKYDCLPDTCRAFDADGNLLFSVPRTHEIVTTPRKTDEWLSCQSGNDMLTTFERANRCNGLRSRLPSPFDPAPFSGP